MSEDSDGPPGLVESSSEERWQQQCNAAERLVESSSPSEDDEDEQQTSDWLRQWRMRCSDEIRPRVQMMRVRAAESSCRAAESSCNRSSGEPMQMMRPQSADSSGQHLQITLPPCCTPCPAPTDTVLFDSLKPAKRRAQESEDRRDSNPTDERRQPRTRRQPLRVTEAAETLCRTENKETATASSQKHSFCSDQVPYWLTQPNVRRQPRTSMQSQRATEAAETLQCYSYSGSQQQAQPAGALMSRWRELKRQHPELFESVQVWQKPAAYSDDVIASVIMGCVCASGAGSLV